LGGEFITLLGGAATAWPLAARAQQSPRPFRIGVLAFGQDPTSPLFDAFRDEMHKLGHIEGQTYVLEFRSARGDADRTQSFAAELARLPVDVILSRQTFSHAVPAGGLAEVGQSLFGFF
jgi:putative ABC transport system substrate-binding protein